MSTAKKLKAQNVRLNEFRQAINQVGTWDIKMCLEGPQTNIDMSSIDYLITVDQAKKLFEQARSFEREKAIAIKWAELCSTDKEINELARVCDKFIWSDYETSSYLVRDAFLKAYHRIIWQILNAIKTFEDAKAAVDLGLYSPFRFENQFEYESNYAEQKMFELCRTDEHVSALSEYWMHNWSGNTKIFQDEILVKLVRVAEICSPEKALEILKTAEYQDPRYSFLHENPFYRTLVRKAATLFRR